MENVEKLGAKVKCTVEEQVLTNVQALGRFPSRMKDTTGAPKEVIAESRLYLQIKNNRKNMLPSSLDFLEAMLEHTKERTNENLAETKLAASREYAQALMAEVRSLGRVPKELNTTEDEESKDEHHLARQLRDARANHIFTESEEAVLVSISETELKTLI
jgi:hypothetical protein